MEAGNGGKGEDFLTAKIEDSSSLALVDSLITGSETRTPLDAKLNYILILPLGAVLPSLKSILFNILSFTA